jgi:uncharacterized protein YqeY
MLRQKLTDALKAAAKSGDKRALSTIRLILAALKDRDIAARGRGQSDGIAEAEILEMLQKMVKQRHESIELYRRGQRDDLVRQEEEEIAVIDRFRPQAMDDSATEAAVAEVMTELQANSIKDMGRVMAALKERYAGRMDFSKASGIVKGRLA